MTLNPLTGDDESNMRYEKEEEAKREKLPPLYRAESTA